MNPRSNNFWYNSRSRVQRWTSWMDNLSNNIIDSGILTTDGKIVSKNGSEVKTFHFNLNENASGFIILEANNLEEAVTLTKDCPIFLYGGNITVRPIIGKY